MTKIDWNRFGKITREENWLWKGIVERKTHGAAIHRKGTLRKDALERKKQKETVKERKIVNKTR